MIIKKKGEETLRETRGKIKGYGKGTFHITNQRVCFDSDKDGMVFNLDYPMLFNWELKKKGIIIKWQELPEGRTTLTAEDPIHKVEIDLECVKHPKDKLSTPDIIHYTLFYAYTNSYDCVGRLGYGWHMNEKGELVHRFRKYSEPMLSERDLVNFGVIRENIEKLWIEDGTGDEKLDQMIFENNEMWNAWQKNNMYHYKQGRTSDEMNQNSLKTGIPNSLDSSIGNYERGLAQEEAEIAELKEAGNTAELEKIIPSNWTGGKDFLGRPLSKTTRAPSGNRYSSLEHTKKLLKAAIRAKEIISGMEFEYYRQYMTYNADVFDSLMAKQYENEDIATYIPEIEKIPDHTIAAKKRIEERRQKISAAQ